ncbi:sugar phosphate isomerase/epimerase family protein, partial [Thermococcus sp.]
KRQLMEIATIAEEYEVKLVMENLTDNRIGAFPHELLPFLEKNVSVCLDIGHAFLTSLKYGLDIGEYFLLDDIEHVHLHDNGGARDEHMAMGEGRIDFNNILPKILFRKPKNIIWEIREYQKEDNVLRSILSVKSPKIRVVR